MLVLLKLLTKHVRKQDHFRPYEGSIEHVPEDLPNSVFQTQTQRAQYPLNREYALNYRGLNIMI